MDIEIPKAVVQILKLLGNGDVAIVGHGNQRDLTAERTRLVIRSQCQEWNYAIEHT